MKNSLILLFISVLVPIAVVASVDYCKLPCGKEMNIGCHHTRRFGPYCPRDATIIKAEPYIDDFVDAHNEYRNFIAGGGDGNHAPACRMATIQWDPDLAYLIALKVLECRMAHDKCHRTKDFQYAGQNLAWSWSTDVDNFDYAEQARRVVIGWFSEVENSTQAIIDSYPQYTKNPVGHFTVMMADRNIRLGCAFATYSDGDGKAILTGCNYATTNMINFPIYKKCSSPGELCKTGRNPKYPNLCSVNEPYEVNKWFK